MRDIMVETMLNKYPYLKILEDAIFFVSKPELDSLKSDRKISANDREISIELLKRILTDDTYYSYAKKLFLNETTEFRIGYVAFGDIMDSIRLTKKDINTGLKSLIATGDIELEGVVKERYDEIKRLFSFESFLKKEKGSKYTI